MSSDHVQLSDVLELTERVQSAINEGEWRAAADLEVDRRTLLARYLEQHQSSEPQALANQLAQLQDTNNRMIGELFHHQRRVEREATTIRTGRRALRAYGEQPQSVQTPNQD